MVDNVTSFFKPRLIVIYLYILFSFIAKPPIMPEIYVTYSLYLVIGYAMLIIVKDKTIYWNKFLTWSLSIMALCFFSMIYAKNMSVTFDRIYYLFIPIALSFAITQLITSEKDIKNILIVLAIAGGILYINMLKYGLFETTERLGQEFAGNANAFASMVLFSTIAAMCTIYLSKNKILWIVMIAIIIANYHMLILSEGRKFLIAPLLFLFILKFKSSGFKFNRLAIIGIVAIIAIPIIWNILVNINVIPDTLVTRIEMTFAILEGRSGYMGEGDLERQRMITKGFEYFTMSPIWGNGHANFSYLFSLEDTGGHIGHFSHNNYIELLCNLGIIGFLVYYAFYYKTLKSTAKIHTKANNIVFTYIIVLMILEFGIVSYYLFYLLQILICIASLAIFDRKKIKIQKT